MTPTPPSSDRIREAERLLRSLAGIVSARVATAQNGDIAEIHILSAPDLNPKQVVRNVESALGAGLGIFVDRRVISVAQIRPDADEEMDVAQPTAEPVTPSPPVSPDDPPTSEIAPAAPATMPPSAAPPGQPLFYGRLAFVDYDAHHQASTGALCRVTLEREGRQFTGSGHGPATAQGRANAAARAVFAAVAATSSTTELGLEDTAMIETQGRTYIFVAARALRGRQSEPLTGVALVQRSPEEAAILASLQALNRFTDTAS